MVLCGWRKMLLPARYVFFARFCQFDGESLTTIQYPESDVCCIRKGRKLHHVQKGSMGRSCMYIHFSKVNISHFIQNLRILIHQHENKANCEIHTNEFSFCFYTSAFIHSAWACIKEYISQSLPVRYLHTLP
jgi:hypothetical protein